MTQSFFQSQYEGAARTQGFQATQVPDVTGQLRQNLQTEQQNYNNLVQVFAQVPQDKGLTELANFSETLSNLMTIAGKKYIEKQKAEGIALFYEDEAAQEVARAQQEEDKATLKGVDNEFNNAAATALKEGVPFEVADRLKGLSGWKKYSYAQAAALSAGNGYKSWMLNQLQTNSEKIILNQGTPEEREVSINDTNLTVAESAAVRAHLRTQYMQETGLMNLSTGLQAEAFKPMHEADTELHGLARKQYAIQKSQEDEQVLIRDFDSNGDAGALITGLQTLVDKNGKPYGTTGAWSRFQQIVTDRALSGDDVNFDAIREQRVPWDSQGRTFGELYGARGQRLNQIELEISKAKIAFYRQENAEEEIEKNKLVDNYRDDLLGREDGFTLEDIDTLQEDLVKRGFGRSRVLDELGATLSLDAQQKKSIDNQAEQLYKVGMLSTEFTRTMPPDLYRKWHGLAVEQEKAMQIPESKTHLDGLSNHVKATTGASSIKNLGGNDTLIIGELQRKYKQKVVELMATGKYTALEAHNAAYSTVLDEYNTGFKTKGHRYFYQNGFPNYMTQVGAKRDAREGNAYLLDRYNTIKALGGITRALDSPNLILSEERLDQVAQSYGTPAFQFPPEAMHFAQQYGISPLEIVNRQLVASGRKALPVPSALQTLGENNRANQALINRYPTSYRSARYFANNDTWSSPTSKRGKFVDTPETGKGYTLKGLNDEQGRPVVMSQPALTAFERMMKDSGGIVKGADITSSQRSKQHNTKVGGVSGSRHLHGLAIDIHGPSRDWMIKNGAKYGWRLIDYQGSHGGHFEYVGGL